MERRYDVRELAVRDADDAASDLEGGRGLGNHTQGAHKFEYYPDSSVLFLPFAQVIAGWKANLPRSRMASRDLPDCR